MFAPQGVCSLGLQCLHLPQGQERVWLVFMCWCAPHALCWPDPGGRFLSSYFLLPKLLQTSPTSHCPIASHPNAFACAAPIAWNAILTSHPSPFTWQLFLQFLKFGSVTSSRKPSLILLPKAESRSFWKLLGRLFCAFWQYLVFIGS